MANTDPAWLTPEQRVRSLELLREYGITGITHLVEPETLKELLEIVQQTHAR